MPRQSFNRFIAMQTSDDFNSPMTGLEKRATVALAGIFMLRMLGLFMILPVFSLYARDLAGTTPFLTGLAISAYGLSQALLAIPSGLLSDRLGRKPVIAVGLLIFAIGSVLAAVADSIQGVIVGRIVQGSGAISSVVMALAADLTREEHRTKAMATMGVSIGFAFLLSMILGPLLAGTIGVPSIFWITAALSLGAIGVLYAVVPTPTLSRLHREAQTVPSLFKAVLANRDLLRLDFGILALHLVLTATFVAVPMILRDYVGLEANKHWLVYLSVMIAAVGAMVPCVIVAEAKRKMKPVFLGAILAVVLANFGLRFLHDDLMHVVALLFVFFTAFNLLEATLPSLISKIAPPDMKGTAMGVYSTSQFFGAFLGGIGGGWIYGRFGLEYVFLFSGLVGLLWLWVAYGMRPPRHLSSMLVNVRDLSGVDVSALTDRLLAVPGVAEAVVMADEGVAYLKIERDRLDRERLQAVLVECAQTA